MSSFFEIKQIDRDAIDYLVRNLENIEKDKDVNGGLANAGGVLKSGGLRRLKQRMKSGSRGFTGNLLKSFTVRVKKRKPGVLVGFRQKGQKGGHAHLVDRGTENRFYKTKTGENKSTGRVIGNFFWTDTASEDYPQAIDRLYEGIEKAVNRINNRQ
ncbi:hypothetical protein LJB87_02000 [Alistipes sp. OttesenSCG-928-L06]|nr:hypothetical protein [Alistipes sp. OttesenSCG-928-L06]